MHVFNFVITVAFSRQVGMLLLKKILIENALSFSLQPKPHLQLVLSEATIIDIVSVPAVSLKKPVVMALKIGLSIFVVEMEKKNVGT